MILLFKLRTLIWPVDISQSWQFSELFGVPITIVVPSPLNPTVLPILEPPFKSSPILTHVLFIFW